MALRSSPAGLGGDACDAFAAAAAFRAGVAATLDEVSFNFVSSAVNCSAVGGTLRSSPVTGLTCGQSIREALVPLRPRACVIEFAAWFVLGLSLDLVVLFATLVAAFLGFFLAFFSGLSL